jgi:beta-glucanase (GH16 family)
MAIRTFLAGLFVSTIYLAACSTTPSSSSSPSPLSGSAGTGVAGMSAAGTTGGATAGVTGGAGTGAAGTAAAAGSSGGTAGPDASTPTDAATDLATPADAATDTSSAPTIKGHPDPTASYPKYDGFSLYLVEEFNAPIALDEDPLWTWGDGTIDDGLARFGEDAITFADGKMKIAITEGATPMSFAVVKGADVAARTLKSGEFRSKYNMFRWGRYEVSMKAPTAESNFVLSMFTFRTPAPQEWREIDFELVANLPASVSTNVIIGQNMTGFVPTSQEVATTYPFGAQPAMALPTGYASTAFHTYAFEALPDHITYFVDGVPVRTKQKGVGANKLIVPERSMKVMFNNWVFNGTAFGGGDPAKNVYPITGEYDWFRFYKWDQDTAYPCEPVPGCLPADDKDLSANNPKEAQ